MVIGLFQQFMQSVSLDLVSTSSFCEQKWWGGNKLGFVLFEHSVLQHSTCSIIYFHNVSMCTVMWQQFLRFNAFYYFGFFTSSSRMCKTRLQLSTNNPQNWSPELTFNSKISICVSTKTAMQGLSVLHAVSWLFVESFVKNWGKANQTVGASDNGCLAAKLSDNGRI